MNEIRLFELRQSAGFVREAREALRVGDLQKAVRYAKMVTRGLYFTRGLSAGHGTGSTLGTAGLTSVLDNLWDAIDKALRPAPAAHPADLVPGIVEALKVLQFRGVDVDDDLLFDRARNAATILGGAFRFTAIEPAPEQLSTYPTTKPKHAN